MKLNLNLLRKVLGVGFLFSAIYETCLIAWSHFSPSLIAEPYAYLLVCVCLLIGFLFLPELRVKTTALIKKDDEATYWLGFFIIIGAFVLTVRVLLWTDSFHSGLLYIAVPFCLSVAFYYFIPYTDGSTWLKRFWNNLRLSVIAFLAISISLMEGYVCVIMFLPIFILLVIIAFICSYLINKYGKNSPKSYVLPVIVMMLSLEGTTELTTLNRYNEVSYSTVINASSDTIKSQITQPIEFKGDRHWILTVFPMPVYVGTVSLNEGDARKYDFIYKRWFFTNTHVGSVNVLFKEVGDNKIITNITDDSYISGYMKLHGTEFTLEPINDDQTRVSLKVSFDRTLDPLWYFQPLERFAVEKGIKFFLKEIFERRLNETSQKLKRELT